MVTSQISALQGGNASAVLSDYSQSTVQNAVQQRNSAGVASNACQLMPSSGNSLQEIIQQTIGEIVRTIANALITLIKQAFSGLTGGLTSAAPATAAATETATKTESGGFLGKAISFASELFGAGGGSGLFSTAADLVSGLFSGGGSSLLKKGKKLLGF